jgi:hypothetical protein
MSLCFEAVQKFTLLKEIFRHRKQKEVGHWHGVSGGPPARRFFRSPQAQNVSVGFKPWILEYLRLKKGLHGITTCATVSQ